MLSHIIFPDHLKFAIGVMIPTFNDKLFGKNVGKLGAITITPSHNLLLGVIVVATGQQMPEN